MNKYIYVLLLLLLYGCHEEEERFLSLSDSQVVFGWKNGTKDITIDSNTHWSVLSKLPSWISFSSLNGESGTSSISIKVTDNDTEDARSSVVTFVIADQEYRLPITQTAKEKLRFLADKTIEMGSSGTELSIDVEQNVSYNVSISVDSDKWVSLVKSNDPFGNLNNIEGSSWKKTLKLAIANNPTREERHAEIIIYNQRFELADTLYITQAAGGGNDKYLDGEYIQLQRATKGTGVDIVIMGDGFTQTDLMQNGHYETIMRQVSDYFFSIEPFQSYQDYFNIYMVVAESSESGVSTNTFGGKVANKFKSTYGSGTAITCDDDLIFQYTRKVKELSKDKPMTVIVALNDKKYAGTTYLYSNGNSIALCPMSAEPSPNDFEGVIHHEAGGHGFGFLCDEYVYYQEKMPESRKRDLREWQKFGFQCNLDFTNDLSVILWKDFIGIDKYSQVGAYEGGYEYQYGVWRSEANSCMNNNIPYFNVQSRWCIVKRIMELSEKNFTVQDFIASDLITTFKGEEPRSVSTGGLPPLGEPMLFRK